MARTAQKRVRITGRKAYCYNCNHMHRHDRKNWWCMATKTWKAQGKEHGCGCSGFEPNYTNKVK